MPFETQCRPIPTIIAQEGNRIVFRLPKNQRKYGWTKRDFYVHGLEDWVSSDSEVIVIEGNDFIALANKGFRG